MKTKHYRLGKPIVAEGHTLAIKYDYDQHSAQILRASVLRGAPCSSPLRGMMPLGTDYRDATPQDFADFNVCPKGYFANIAKTNQTPST
jgi:hypothetical protein